MGASTTVQRYKLAMPCEQDVLASLTRLVGIDEAGRLWVAACRQVEIGQDENALTLEQLDAVLQQLVQVRGLASVAATSMLVRVKSFRTLAAMYSE